MDTGLSSYCSCCVFYERYCSEVERNVDKWVSDRRVIVNLQWRWIVSVSGTFCVERVSVPTCQSQLRVHCWPLHCSLVITVPCTATCYLALTLPGFRLLHILHSHNKEIISSIDPLILIRSKIGRILFWIFIFVKFGFHSVLICRKDLNNEHKQTNTSHFLYTIKQWSQIKGMVKIRLFFGAMTISLNWRHLKFFWLWYIRRNRFSLYDLCLKVDKFLHKNENIKKM